MGELDTTDLSGWRAEQRGRLIGLRRAIADDVRRAKEGRIVAALRARLADPRGRVVALYWPIQGEPDLRQWMHELHEQGTVCALPAVVGRDRPLEFRRWHPLAEMHCDKWGICVPLATESVAPDVVLAPLVGFDAKRYRLGFGGGYYDRTFAVLPKACLKIGVGFADCQLPTIFPRDHDVPMDVIVTE